MVSFDDCGTQYRKGLFLVLFIDMPFRLQVFYRCDCTVCIAHTVLVQSTYRRSKKGFSLVFTAVIVHCTGTTTTMTMTTTMTPAAEMRLGLSEISRSDNGRHSNMTHYCRVSNIHEHSTQVL
jgi:hypothetical protein